MSLQIFTIHRPFICIAMRKQRNINNVNDLQPRTQQWAITSELPTPSGMSEKNGHCVNMVY